MSAPGAPSPLRDLDLTACKPTFGTSNEVGLRASRIETAADVPLAHGADKRDHRTSPRAPIRDAWADGLRREYGGSPNSARSLSLKKRLATL
jgi:hypothetical protein